jgi:hypothetical protein
MNRDWEQHVQRDGSAANRMGPNLHGLREASSTTLASEAGCPFPRGSRRGEGDIQRPNHAAKVDTREIHEADELSRHIADTSHSQPGRGFTGLDRDSRVRAEEEPPQQPHVRVVGAHAAPTAALPTLSDSARRGGRQAQRLGTDT